MVFSNLEALIHWGNTHQLVTSVVLNSGEKWAILVFHTELLGKNSTTSSPDSPADYNAILKDANTLLKENDGQVASLGKGSGEAIVEEIGGDHPSAMVPCGGGGVEACGGVLWSVGECCGVLGSDEMKCDGWSPQLQKVTSTPKKSPQS